ncbi:hypothetical protein LINGRAHAP2_LOCUS20436 [Linum grandiflorum]
MNRPPAACLTGGSNNRETREIKWVWVEEAPGFATGLLILHVVGSNFVVKSSRLLKERERGIKLHVHPRFFDRYSYPLHLKVVCSCLVY